jgi:N-acetylglutamate synthase
VLVSIDEALSGLGRRVSVRRVVGTRDGRPLLSDVVGVLESAGDDDVVVRLRSGATVAFARESVVAAKIVPVRGLRLTGRQLEEISAAGWRGLETQWQGDWLMRAAGGFTGRANSALLLGDPGMALPGAVDEVKGWYAARGLPPKFQVPLPDSASADQWLAEHGWTWFDEVRVLVADIDHLLEATLADVGPARVITVDPHPDDAWLAAYHYRGGALPAHARSVIDNGDQLGFASVRTVSGTGEVLAIARGSVDRRWLGVTAVEVVPSQRGQGLAGIVLGALATWADGLGAHSCYLQVSVDNAAALALYQRAGFVDHHRYHYRKTSPGQT